MIWLKQIMPWTIVPLRMIGPVFKENMHILLEIDNGKWMDVNKTTSISLSGVHSKVRGEKTKVREKSLTSKKKNIYI